MPQRRIGILACVAACMAGGMLAGCVKDRPATTQPIATDINPNMAEPDYWLAKPATQKVAGADYDRLLTDCQRTVQDRRFVIDRTDYRSGLVITRPLVSKQNWEFWRGDVVDAASLEKSSIATYRRTVQWQVAKTGTGTWEASPKVVVERFTAPPARITTVVNPWAALNAQESQNAVAQGNLRTIGEQHWYAVGRDLALERQLAKDLDGLINRK